MKCRHCGNLMYMDYFMDFDGLWILEWCCDDCGSHEFILKRYDTRQAAKTYYE